MGGVRSQPQFGGLNPKPYRWNMPKMWAADVPGAHIYIYIYIYMAGIYGNIYTPDARCVFEKRASSGPASKPVPGHVSHNKNRHFRGTVSQKEKPKITNWYVMEAVWSIFGFLFCCTLFLLILVVVIFLSVATKEGGRRKRTNGVGLFPPPHKITK